MASAQTGAALQELKLVSYKLINFSDFSYFKITFQRSFSEVVVLEKALLCCDSYQTRQYFDEISYNSKKLEQRE